MLDELIARPLVDGDVLATANTLIYMGKIREGDRFSRGLFIAKHRGSACSDEILRLHDRRSGYSADLIAKRLGIMRVFDRA